MIKVPWYTCSRVLEAFRDVIEVEEMPECFLENLRKLNSNPEWIEKRKWNTTETLDSKENK